MYKRHIRNIKPVKDTQSLNRDNNDTKSLNLLYKITQNKYIKLSHANTHQNRNTQQINNTTKQITTQTPTKMNNAYIQKEIKDAKQPNITQTNQKQQEQPKNTTNQNIIQNSSDIIIMPNYKRQVPQQPTINKPVNTSIKKQVTTTTDIKKNNDNISKLQLKNKSDPSKYTIYDSNYIESSNGSNNYVLNTDNLLFKNPSYISSYGYDKLKISMIDNNQHSISSSIIDPYMISCKNINAHDCKFKSLSSDYIETSTGKIHSLPKSNNDIVNKQYIDSVIKQFNSSSLNNVFIHNQNNNSLISKVPLSCFQLNVNNIKSINKINEYDTLNIKLTDNNEINIYEDNHSFRFNPYSGIIRCENGLTIQDYDDENKQTTIKPSEIISHKITILGDDLTDNVILECARKNGNIALKISLCDGNTKSELYLMPDGTIKK